MKVHELITILQTMPADYEVEVNDNQDGEVSPIEDVTRYEPNLDLWPDDQPAVVIQVNCEM